MSRTGLYHYFSDKKELFQAVIEFEFGIMSSRTRRAVSLASTPVEKIRAYVHTRMETVLELGSYYRAMVDEYFEHLGFVEKFRRKANETEIISLQFILDEGVSKGLFSVKDTSLTALGISMALKGLEIPWAIRKEKKKIRKEMDILLDLLFWGIMRK